MTRPVEQIERDIAALEDTVRQIAIQLNTAYTKYLTAFGQAMQQQLILACYHLCTHGYPEKFLSLSFQKRQQLQQVMRQLGQKAASELLAYTKVESEAKIENEAQIEQARELENISASSVLSIPELSNPTILVVWQQHLEQAIAHTLKTASSQANSLFQQAGILPNKLPSTLLEAAISSSEASAEVITGAPNLLKLLIETEEPDLENSNVTQLIAIHLRLAEIEFADASVRTFRQQIRQLELQVRSLAKEYQKKQQERAVAAAEAAWRASWFDE